MGQFWPEYNWYIILENSLAIYVNYFVNTHTVGMIIPKLSCTKESNSSESLVSSLFSQLRGKNDEHLWGRFYGLGLTMAFHYLLSPCIG